MTKYTNDYTKFMSVTSFSAGKGIDEIENNMSLLIWIPAKDLIVAKAHLHKSNHKSLSLFGTFIESSHEEQ